MLDLKSSNWQYCCRGRSCCPQVIKQGEELFIKDDDQNVVHLTVDQLLDIVQYVHENRDT